MKYELVTQPELTGIANDLIRRAADQRDLLTAAAISAIGGDRVRCCDENCREDAIRKSCRASDNRATGGILRWTSGDCRRVRWTKVSEKRHWQGTAHAGDKPLRGARISARNDGRYQQRLGIDRVFAAGGAGQVRGNPQNSWYRNFSVLGGGDASEKLPDGRLRRFRRYCAYSGRCCRRG